MTDFNPHKIAEFIDILGLEKMQALWKLFIDEAENCFDDPLKKDPNRLRLNFHSLRSAALVFGMESFSACCASLEEAFINNSENSEIAKKIEQAKLIFNHECRLVGAYL